MARTLGPEGRGEYQVAAILWAVIPGVLTLSLGTVIAFQRQLPRGRWSLTWAFAFSLAGSAAVAALLFARVVGTQIGLPLLALSVGFMSSDLLQGNLRRKNMFGSLAAYRWIDVGGGSVGIVVLALIGVLSPATATVALCLSTVLAVIAGTWLSARKPNRDIGPFPWRVVPPVHGATLLRMATTWTGQLVVVATLGLGPLGIFAIASSVATQFTILPSAVSTVLLRVAAEDRGRGARALAQSISLVLWAGFLAAVLLAFVGSFLFEIIFGGDFSKAGSVAALLTIGATTNGLILLLESYLLGSGRFASGLKARLLFLPSAVLVLPIVILSKNLYATALFDTATNLATLIALVFLSAKQAELSFVSLLLPPRPTRVRELWLAFRGPK